MSQSAGLFRNTIIYTIGNLGSRILAFVLVPFYTIYLSKSEMGLYDLIITTVSLLVPLITLQVAEAVYRWLLEAAGDGEKISIAITNSFIVLIASCALFLFLCSFATLFTHFDLFIYTILYILSNIFVNFLQQISRGLGKSKLYAVSGVLNTFLMVVLTLIFFVFLKLGLPGILLSGIISSFITALIIFSFSDLLKYFNFGKASKSEIRSMVKYSWPLIPNAVGWWLINEINRFIILYFLGVEANGIFAIAVRFPSLLVMLNSIFMLSWQDLSIGSKGGREEEKEANNSRIFKRFMILEFTLVIMLIAISKYFVDLLIDPKFFESWKYMPLLYLGVAFASFSSFIGAAYLNAKKTRSIFLTTLAGSVVNILVCILLIRPFGLFAPAIGTLAGYFLMWVIRVYETRSFFSIKINYVLFCMLLTAAFLITGIVFLDNFYSNMIVALFAFLLLIILNRPLIKFFWQQLFYNYLMGLRSKGSL